MYTRYIPQPDGTYRRSHIQDPPKPREPVFQDSPPPPPPPPLMPPRPQEPKQGGSFCPQPNPFRQSRKQTEPVAGSVGNFLKQLLPRNFDTADLIVVLLLLLIATDGCDDGNTALLTLVLYLFL